MGLVLPVKVVLLTDVLTNRLTFRRVEKEAIGRETIVQVRLPEGPRVKRAHDYLVEVEVRIARKRRVLKNLSEVHFRDKSGACTTVPRHGIHTTNQPPT